MARPAVQPPTVSRWPPPCLPTCVITTCPTGVVTHRAAGRRLRCVCSPGPLPPLGLPMPRARARARWSRWSRWSRCLCVPRASWPRRRWHHRRLSRPSRRRSSQRSGTAALGTSPAARRLPPTRSSLRKTAPGSRPAGGAHVAPPAGPEPGLHRAVRPPRAVPPPRGLDSEPVQGAELQQGPPRGAGQPNPLGAGICLRARQQRPLRRGGAVPRGATR